MYIFLGLILLAVGGSIIFKGTQIRKEKRYIKCWLVITAGTLCMIGALGTMAQQSHKTATVLTILVPALLGYKLLKSRGARLFIAAFAVVAILLALNPPDLSQIAAAREAHAQTAVANSDNGVSEKTKESYFMEEAKDAVRSRLKDADSATFQKVRHYNSKQYGHIACGEVNAKNSFGGYTGFQRFFSNSTSSLTFTEQDMEPADFAKTWNTLCAN